MSSNRVAIIGAGPSGLVSAKYALDNGLDPVVFEKTNNFGGLWAGARNGTAIWEGLFTDISHYTMMFSDYPWPKESDIFQTSHGIHNYLIGYARKFKIDEHMNFNCEVKHAKRLENKKWEIKSIDLTSKVEKTEIFDFLIIASGLHSQPKIPKFEDSSKFKGIQIHSSEFKLNDPKLKSKKVVVIGCSASGTEIAANLVNHAESVVSVFPKPYLVMPRLAAFKLKSESNKSYYTILPVDILVSKRSATYHNPDVTPDQLKLGRNKYFSSLFSYQTNKDICHPALYVDLETTKTLYFAVSDYYISHVRQNKIKPIQNKIKKLDENGLIFEDGTFESADAIVYCTGYNIQNTYLEESVIKQLKFDSNINRYPYLLYKCTLHPELQNFAMVGHVNGIFYVGAELQAKLAAMYFSKKIQISKDEMIKDISEAEANRSKNLNAQFPNGNHVEMIDKLAKDMNLLPDFDEMKTKNPELYNMFWNTSTNSMNFVYKHNETEALNIMREINDMTNKVYEYDGIDEISLAEAAEKFSQFYKLPKGLFN